MACFCSSVGCGEVRTSRRRRGENACVVTSARMVDVPRGFASAALGVALGWMVCTGDPVGMSRADLPHDLVLDAVEIVRKNSLYKPSLDLHSFLVDSMAQDLASTEDGYKLIRTMLKSLGDKYSRFLTPEEFSRLSKYDVTGLGLLLSPDMRGKLIVAATPTDKSSALDQGVLRGDFVEAISGKNTDNMAAMEALTLLQGDDGSTVDVRIRTPGSEPRQVKLTRRMNTPNPVTYKLKTIHGKRIGYIRLKEFNASCNLKVRDAITDLQRQGVDSYVLDLRSNLGGVVEGALEIAGLFMDKNAAVIKVVNRDGMERNMSAKEIGKREVVQEPLIIVTDRYSASASEVLTAGLRDNCRAVSVGAQTFGKGVIQGAYALKDGSAVVLTVAKYQTPTGSEINGIGIAPDISMYQPGKLFDARLGTINFDNVNSMLKACVPVS